MRAGARSTGDRLSHGESCKILFRTLNMKVLLCGVAAACPGFRQVFLSYASFQMFTTANLAECTIDFSPESLQEEPWVLRSCRKSMPIFAWH